MDTLFSHFAGLRTNLTKKVTTDELAAEAGINVFFTLYHSIQQ